MYRLTPPVDPALPRSAPIRARFAASVVAAIAFADCGTRNGTMRLGSARMPSRERAITGADVFAISSPQWVSHPE
jgi:hypothetical protein